MRAEVTHETDATAARAHAAVDDHVALLALVRVGIRGRVRVGVRVRVRVGARGRGRGRGRGKGCLEAVDVGDG